MPPTTPTLDIWSTLAAAQKNSADLSAERDFLAALPLRLSISGGLLAYGMASGKPWAKWGGGIALVWQGVEYLAARRRAELAAAAAAAAPPKPARLGAREQAATEDAGQGLAAPQDDDGDDDELGALRRARHQPPEVLG